MKNKTQQTTGWLDNFNDSKVSLPLGFVGEGTFNGPQWESPAWGGSFQMGGSVYPVNYVPEAAMGGSIPGAVGFTYARTQSPAPSNGKYAKKTMASAQNGKEMQYYQNGLDFQPKSISKNGSWLSKYDVAQDGDILDKFRESHPSVRSIRNDAMNRKIQESKGRGKETTVTQKDNTRTVTPKEIKKLSGKEQNELAQRQSEEQARKDYVQANMEEAYKSPLMSPGYFTPEGAAIGALQGATKMGPDLYEGDYKAAAMDALMMLPIAIPAAKTLKNIKNINPEGKIFSGMNNELNNMAIQNTERYMAKRTPTTSTLSSEMEPYVSRYTKLSDEPYIPYQEDEYIKWFNEQKAKMNPSTPIQDPRSILRRSSVIDINDVPNNNFELFDLNNVRKPSGSIGNQGATPEGARDILKSIGIEVESATSGQPTFKEMIEHLKNNPKDAATYKKFLEKEPINVSELPDGSYQINDGHHRATLSYYSGNENIPTIIKNKGEYIKQRDGGIIKDDRGQWDHPGEITEIGSNDITMEGVPYDVLGISDTGDTKLMKPGKNYKFKGKKVTEYPMAKNGLRQEQKGLQNLDNLLNFSNYNVPEKGGWLKKYSK